MKLRLIIILAYVLLLSFSAFAQSAYERPVKAVKVPDGGSTGKYHIGTDSEGNKYYAQLIKYGVWKIALYSDRPQQCEAEATLRLFTMDGNPIFLSQDYLAFCDRDSYVAFFTFMDLDGKGITMDEEKSEKFLQELIASGTKSAQLIIPGEFIEIKTNEFGIYFFRKGYVAVNDMLTDPMDKAIDGAINLLKSFKD